MRARLKQMCMRLPLQEKVELRDFLSGLLTSTRYGVTMTPLRCSILLGEMATIMGKPTISYESRNPSDVWARTMVAYQMIQEGYSTTEIGNQMIKDHSTITHMKKKMQDALGLPQAYRDILEIWDKFQNRIQL